MNTLMLLTVIVSALALGFCLARKVEEMAHPLQGLMPPLFLAVLLVVALTFGLSLVTLGACTFVTSFCVATWSLYDAEERAAKRLKNRASPFNLHSDPPTTMTEADNPFARRQPNPESKRTKGWVGPGVRQTPGGAIIKLESHNHVPRRRQGSAQDDRQATLVRVK